MDERSWGKDLDLGVESLDVEHRLMVDLVNDLEGAMGEEKRERAGATLRQLHDFTHVHFLAEDLLMRVHAYAGHQAHAAEHAHLAEQLVELRAAHSRGDLPVSLDLVAGLRQWLGGHQTHDRALAAFLLRLGIT